MQGFMHFYYEKNYL